MPSLQLKPCEGPVGTSVMVIGAGFRPNVGYRIQLRDQWLRAGTTNNRGGFVTFIQVPPVPYGDHNVIAISQAAHQLARATFKVVPQITRIDPGKLTVGDIVTVTGTGLGSREPIQLRMNDRLVPLQENVLTNPDGTFTVSFTVTEEWISPTPAVILVIGVETGASAQSSQKMEWKLAS